jgi:putative cell wall-binding protein
LGAFGPVDWVWGQDRYETAAKISADAFPSGAATVYVAYGGNFPDALGAAAAAAQAAGPVVLVLTGSVPAAAAAEIQRLSPTRIVATGGPSVISNDVVSALGAFAPVDWVWGQDRYETAAKISADAFPAGASTVYVASGDAFADALPSAAAAAQAGGPVLLVRKDGVPAVTAAELTRLAPSRIVATGGPAVLSNAVVSALGAFGTVDWLWGSTRYGTAAKIAADAFPSGAATAYVAYGGNFPDALGAAAAAARAGGPVLLVRNNGVPTETADELRRLSPSRIVVVGGPGVFSGTSWGLRNSLSSGGANSSYQLGAVGHFPLMGDWTGAGVATACSVIATGSGALRWSIRNIEGPGRPDNVFEYGRAGDIPIAGDWSGNGVTTPGVVRGNQWLLRHRNSAGSADVSFSFGQPGDIPVVGRWTGAGVDLPGVVRGSTWLLKTSLAGGDADIEFDFGPETAQPVAGDWNNAGRDFPGRFENGQWQLRHSLSGGGADSTFSFGVAHDTPLVWGRVT